MREPEARQRQYRAILNDRLCYADGVGHGVRRRMLCAVCAARRPVGGRASQSFGHLSCRRENTNHRRGRLGGHVVSCG